MDSIIEALFQRHPCIASRLEEWSAVEQVLSQNFKDGSASSWLPKSRSEPQDEYELRVKLTPFFPRTPEVLSGRQGLLFSKPLVTSGTNPLFDKSNAAGDNILTLAEQLSSKLQIFGIIACFLDNNGTRPYVSLFAGPQIMDWKLSPDGSMEWIKLVESKTFRVSWSTPLRTEMKFFVISRDSISIYLVDFTDSQEPVLSSSDIFSHGFGRVPVVLSQPFTGPDNIGYSILRANADADLAAARILSDIVWCLHLIGSPILTYSTNKSSEELKAFVLGASRYQAIANGRPELENPESLSFTKLDDRGLQLMFRAYLLMDARARAADPSEANAETVEQSGIAIGWKFHTGEERTLHLLARAVESALNSLLALTGGGSVTTNKDFQPNLLDTQQVVV